MKHNAEHLQGIINAQGQYIPQGHGVEVSVDTNRDGVVDTIVHHGSDAHTREVLDSDYDGKFDMVLEHGTAYDSSVSVYLDTDGDGRMDEMLEDSDGDGVWDTRMTDSDGDGVFDAPAEHGLDS